MKKAIHAALAVVGLLLSGPVSVLASSPTAPVPEPSTVFLIGGGLGAVILLARRKRAGK